MDLYGNFSTCTLTATLAVEDTVATVDNTTLIPDPAGGEVWLTLLSTSGGREIVQVTAKSATTLTIERAKEGTTAQSFPSGSTVKGSLTASMLDRGLVKRLANDKLETDLPNSYPEGISIGAVTTSRGWPITGTLIVVSEENSTYLSQTLIPISSGVLGTYVRGSASATTWRNWNAQGYDAKWTAASTPGEYPNGVQMTTWAAGGEGNPDATSTFQVITFKVSTSSHLQIAIVRSSSAQRPLWWRQATGSSVWGAWNSAAQADHTHAVPPLHAPAAALSPRLGQAASGPTHVNTGYAYLAGWQMNDATTSSVGTTFEVPGDWVTADIDVTYMVSTTTVGNIAFRAIHRAVAIDAVVSGTGTSTVAAAAGGSLTTIRRARLASAVTVLNTGGTTGLMLVNVERMGSDALDTYTGAVYVVGVTMTRAS